MNVNIVKNITININMKDITRDEKKKNDLLYRTIKNNLSAVLKLFIHNCIGNYYRKTYTAAADVSNKRGDFT